MKIGRYIVIVLLLFTACVKEVDWDVPEDGADMIVIDATLTDEQKLHEVNISYPLEDLNKFPEPVKGATVLVSNEDSDWILFEDPSGPGIYRTDSTFVALLGKNYTLQVFHQGRIYSAKANMEPAQFFNPLLIEEVENGLYKIDYVASGFDAESPAKWEVLIDWSNVPGYNCDEYKECHARLLFYSLPTLDVSQIFAPEVEELLFPAGSIITQRRYSLTPGHAEFIRTLLLETTWQGSLFPTENANITTNLSSGATGYFAVCAVTELSFTVE